MCFELNSTSKASNANSTYLEQIGAPLIYQNSWGANSVCVPTKDARDAYDKIIHFNKIKGKMVLLGVDWSDWLYRSVRPV